MPLMPLQLPRFVFRVPGPIQRAGGTYAQELVQDQREMDAALKSGWFTTLPEAIEPPNPEPIAGAPGQDVVPPSGERGTAGTADPDDAPPTRAELEAKAHELGIEFSPKIGDKKLAERIQEALSKEA